LSTYVLGAAEPVSAVRYLDLILLVMVLPIFLLTGLPMLGYAAAAVAWLGQRLIQVLLLRRASASTEPKVVVGITAASMIGRGYLVALTILGAGLMEREAGLAAAILVIVLFTVYFGTAVVTHAFDPPQRPAP